MAQSEAERAKPATDELRAKIARVVDEGDWDAELAYQQQLLEMTEDAAEQGDILHRIGDLFFHKYGDTAKAVEYYAEALFLKPDCVQLLKVTADLYIEREQWTEAIEMCLRQAVTEDDPVARVSRFIRAARIAEEKLKDIDAAVSHYGRALDTLLENLPPMTKLEDLLEMTGDIERLRIVYDDAIEYLQIWLDRLRDARLEIGEADDEPSAGAPSAEATSDELVHQASGGSSRAHAASVAALDEETPPSATDAVNEHAVDRPPAPPAPVVAVTDAADVESLPALVAAVESAADAETSPRTPLSLDAAAADATVPALPVTAEVDAPSGAKEIDTPPAPAAEVEASPPAPAAEVEASPPAPAAEDEASPPAPAAEVEASPPVPAAEAEGPLEASPPAPEAEALLESPPSAPAAEAPLEASPPAPEAEAPLEASPPAPAAEGPLESSPPAPEADTPLEEPPPSVLDLVASIAESPPSAPSPPAVADLKPPPPPPGAIASERGDAAHRSSTPASGPVTPPPPPSAAVAGQDTIATVATSPPALPQHDVRPSAPSTTDETPSPAPEDEESTSAADAEQRTALWKRVEECQQSGDLSGVVDALQRLLPLVSDPQKRWKIHANLGDIALHKMDDTPAAARHFQDALKIRPRSKATLLSLLEIYTKTRNFRGAVDVMRPLCDLESDPRKLALYFTTLGTIYVEELGQWDDAVIVYNRALDLNPTTHKTFERIEKILTRRKAWLRMEENYRAHLARIEGDASQEELHQHILRALGKLYMNELERLEEALVIYQRLRTMRPDDSGIQETICEIYDGMADYNPGVLDQLITENRRLLQMLPGNVAGYKTLADAFIRNAMYDQAFSVCSVLVAKRFADSQEEGFFLKHRGGVPRFASALRGSQYASFLYPERLRGALTQILELVASQLPDSIFPAPPRKKAKRKKRVERGDNMVIDIAMRTVLSNFDVDLPELYIDEDVGSLVALPTRPPCLLISPEWLIDRPLPQLAFALGIQAVHFLPQFSLVPMGVAQVRDIVHAVIRACAPSVPVDTTDEIESLREIFANMPEHKLLWSYTQTLLSAGRELEIEEWFNDVERLAYRVGLLLCNDFEAAMTTIHEAHFERRLPPQELEEELSLFAISDAYAKLRRELGVAI